MAAPRRKKAPAAAAPESDVPAAPETGVPSAPVALALPAELNFVAATKLHADLLAVRDVPEVVLDAAAVERMSTAGVLVLLSFLAARAEMKPPAAVANPPGPFVDAFSELGLFGKLMSMEFRT